MPLLPSINVNKTFDSSSSTSQANASSFRTLFPAISPKTQERIMRKVSNPSSLASLRQKGSVVDKAGVRPMSAFEKANPLAYYKYIKPLGRGHSGSVAQYLHVPTKQFVAIKTSFMPSRRTVQNEISVATVLSGKSDVTAVKEQIVTGNRLYTVMEELVACPKDVPLTNKKGTEFKKYKKNGVVLKDRNPNKNEMCRKTVDNLRASYQRVQIDFDHARINKKQFFASSDL